MDYEKKYNEMVRRAKELYESGNALTRQQMGIVCPELTESEDERIRKFLLRLAKRCNENSIDFLGDIKKKDVIAYLEKQKEQKCDTCPNRGNTHQYLKGYADGKREAELSANRAVVSRQSSMDGRVIYDLREKCFDHSDLITQFKAGVNWQRERDLAVLASNIDRAQKCMEESTGYDEYPYWDGAHDMANAIRREIEREE